MKSLLLGAGRDHRKQVHFVGKPEWAGELVTLDMNPRSEPTVTWDLEKRPLPFPDNEFAELGAFDVLEHLGRQGDWKGWFEEMAEYHRILKPGGFFFVLVPIGDDALADPGHTRFFQGNWFGFCSRRFYEIHERARSKATDYRWYLDKHHPALNFDVLDIDEKNGHHMAVIMRKA
jgi:SAM-dependent methyltransferase